MHIGQDLRRAGIHRPAATCPGLFRGDASVALLPGQGPAAGLIGVQLAGRHFWVDVGPLCAIFNQETKGCSGIKNEELLVVSPQRFSTPAPPMQLVLNGRPVSVALVRFYIKLQPCSNPDIGAPAGGTGICRLIQGKPVAAAKALHRAFHFFYLHPAAGKERIFGPGNIHGVLQRSGGDALHLADNQIDTPHFSQTVAQSFLFNLRQSVFQQANFVQIPTPLD